ncbi:MAG: hypothetical protein R3202_10570, partial [Candidatus Competibacterales bacterium]|nr:hypothetical protein [Candidatus Competibacterales bacterium]
RGGPCMLLTFTVACWFRYLTGTDDRGREMPVIDPMKDKLMEHARRGGRDPGALLDLRELFGTALTGSPVFVDQLRQILESFHDRGAEATLEQYVGP